MPQFKVTGVMRTGPLTFGVVRPCILIPRHWLPQEAFVQDMEEPLGAYDAIPKSPEEVFVALLHEYGHLKHLDGLRAAVRALACIFFPIEWVAVGMMRQSVEASYRQSGWFEACIHKIFERTRGLISPLIEADWIEQEHRADKVAESVITNTESTLARLRLQVPDDRPKAPEWKKRVWIGGVHALIGASLIVAGVWFAPGRALIEYSLGGSGEVVGSVHSLAIRLGPLALPPKVGYLLPTRTRGPRIAIDIAPPKTPSPQSDLPDGFGITLALGGFLEKPKDGPYLSHARCEFWYSGPGEGKGYDLAGVYVAPEGVRDKGLSVIVFAQNTARAHPMAQLGPGHYSTEWEGMVPAGARVHMYEVFVFCGAAGHYEIAAPVLDELVASPDRKD